MDRLGHSKEDRDFGTRGQWPGQEVGSSTKPQTQREAGHSLWGHQEQGVPREVCVGGPEASSCRPLRVRRIHCFRVPTRHLGEERSSPGTEFELQTDLNLLRCGYKHRARAVFLTLPGGTGSELESAAILKSLVFWGEPF